MIAADTPVLLTNGCWKCAATLAPGDRLHGQHAGAVAEVVEVAGPLPVPAYALWLSDASTLVTDGAERVVSWSPGARKAAACARRRIEQGVHKSMAGRPRTAREAQVTVAALAQTLSYGGRKEYRHALALHDPVVPGALEAVRELLSDRRPHPPEGWASWSTDAAGADGIVQALLLAGIVPRVYERAPGRITVTVRPPPHAWPPDSDGAIWARSIARRSARYRTVRAVDAAGVVDCVAVRVSPPKPDRPESYFGRLARQRRPVETLFGRGLVPVLGVSPDAPMVSRQDNRRYSHVV